MDTPLPTHVPALIAAYMRGSGTQTGPFTVGLDAHSDDPMRNYAVPDHGARPGAGDIDALITLFRHRHRVPRLEYIEEDAPRAWPALAAAGFTIERRTPVMIATPATTLTPRSPAGITILLATSDTDLAAAATVQHHAYQLTAPPGPQDVARLTRLTQRGGLVVPPPGHRLRLQRPPGQDRPLPRHRPGLPGSRARRRTDLPPHRVHRQHHQDLGLDPLTSPGSVRPPAWRVRSGL
jgi:hypothetical protein